MAQVPAPVAVGQRIDTAAGQDSVITLTADVPKGQRVIVGYVSLNADTDGAITCSDSKGNTYTKDAEHRATARATIIFSTEVTTALVAGDTITVHALVNSSKRSSDAIASPFLGAPETTSIGSNASSSTPSSGTTATRKKPSSLLYGLAGWNSSASGETFTAGGSFGNVNIVEAFAAGTGRVLAREYQIVSAVGTDAATGTLAGARNWAMLEVVYPTSTRFYFALEPRQVAALTPAVDAAWEASEAFFGRRRAITLVHPAEQGNSGRIGRAGSTSTGDVAWEQWISDPLRVDQTVSGRVRMVVRAWETDTLENANLAFVLRVVAPDGSIRGTLYSSFTDGTEFAVNGGGPGETRTLGPFTMTNVSGLAGDRLVLDLGVHFITPVNNPGGVTVQLPPGTGFTDYDFTEGITTNGNPWWELPDGVDLVLEQILAPSADVTDGGWLNEAASNVNLFASVDEGVTPNDADWIQSGAAPASDLCELQLQAGVVPDAGPVDLVVRYLTA